MKYPITIKVILFCSLALGVAGLASPITASASQIPVGIGIGIAPVHHWHHRHHHRRAIIIAPKHHYDRHDNGEHRGQDKHEDHKDRR